jgi:hypothetical protein
MSRTLSPPTERECERCGRQDVWDERQREWTIATVDGERQVGDPYCIHEWDVTGAYNPFEGTV